jgi:NADH-quinone oxidoreductase subunit M
MEPISFLTALIFLPTLGALILVGFNKNAVDPMRFFTFGVTFVTFLMSLYLWLGPVESGCYNPAEAGVQPVVDGVHGVSAEWIGGWNIHYRLGYDGISLPLILLTSFTSMLAALASWSINKLHN